MNQATLRDCRILVVEDEYMLADELRTELLDAGATVLGPVGTIEDALELIAGETAIDGAILDINLRGEMVFPAADLLTQRNVPFAFATGYEESAIPDRFKQITRCEKPVDLNRITQALRQVA